MEGNKPKTVKCRVIELEEGVYSKIVIQDLVSFEYMIFTVFPNWQSVIPKKDDIGYLEYEFAEAGSLYFNKDTKTKECYNNTYFIFRTFIKETPRSQEDVIL